MSLAFGDFEISPETYELRRAGQPVHVEPRVFELLAYLLAHRGRLVSKQELLERLWSNEFVTESALSRAVRDARRALGESGAEKRWIETVHGRGFRFAGEVSERATPEQAAGATAAAPAVAVLPLEDLSPGGPPGFLAGGMTDALITELAKIGLLKVISRTSVMRYQGARKPLPDIARELGVERIVEGSVLRDGERVRITAQLVSADTGEHHDIAQRVNERLTSRQTPRLASRRQVEPEVFLLDPRGPALDRPARRAGVPQSARLLRASDHRRPDLRAGPRRPGRGLRDARQLRRRAKGLSELEAAVALSRRGARFLGYLGYARGRAGSRAEALALLRELEQSSAERYVPPYFFALIHAGLGNRSRALDELERAWQVRDSMLRDLKVDPLRRTTPCCSSPRTGRPDSPSRPRREAHRRLECRSDWAHRCS